MLIFEYITDPNEWNTHLKNLKISSMHLSWDLFDALVQHNSRIKPIRILVRLHQRPLAILQGYTQSFLYCFQYTKFNYGPIFFENHKKIKFFNPILLKLKSIFHHPPRAFLTLIPNLTVEEYHKHPHTLESFFKIGPQSEQYLCALPYTPSHRWQRSLKKSMNAASVVHWDFNTNRELIYALYRQQSRKHRLTPQTTPQLMPQETQLTLRAYTEHHTLAAMIFILHGHTATQLFSFCSLEGRKLHTGHLLFHKAAQWLEENNYTFIDLGTFRNKAPTSLSVFKESMGAQRIHYVGQYLSI